MKLEQPHKPLRCWGVGVKYGGGGGGAVDARRSGVAAGRDIRPQLVTLLPPSTFSTMLVS